MKEDVGKGDLVLSKYKCNIIQYFATRDSHMDVGLTEPHK